MINIALFGPPGAGKGTQSAFLIEKYNLFYISTGDLLRKEIAEETKLGLQAMNIIAAGKLVSDEIIIQILEKTIKENSQAGGFLFDGFPRTYIQAYILEGLMIQLHTSLNCLISIEVPEDESVARLLNRGLTSGRSDDNELVIRKRLKEYEEKTLPVLNFYKEKGNYIAIDGHKTIGEVTAQIEEIINKELSKKLMNVVIFGYPGSGRGSLGIALSKKYGLEYISTGRMLEEEIAAGTEVGKRITQLYENGELVPDEIVIPLLLKKIHNSKSVKGYIFKGFPRTLVQSYILDGILKKHNSKIRKIIDIQVSTLEVISRLDQRSKTSHCKPYDTSIEKIVRRLKEHEEKTIPVLHKYKEIHDVSIVNGEGTFDEVLERMSAEIEKGFKYLR
ncbi:MAG TPA: adenylate kinase [Prolixibacteraceae bacterium]